MNRGPRRLGSEFPQQLGETRRDGFRRATALLNVAVHPQYGQSFFGTASALSFVVTLMVIVTAVPLMSWLRRREVPM
ncbi:hypothetical protein ACGFY9_45000 [Streptomyces sp. NPDC048504]|uniref:hypothetical protein n=1 Tax=Streptomyces sp. NPDC048504 TaxID=3365559 RepID=UPI003724C4CD